MKSSAAIRLKITTCALIASTIHAHGYLSYPPATYIDSATKTGFSAKIPESVNAGFQGKKWNDSPENNAATFTQSWPSTGYLSLREMVDPSVPGCSNTRLDVDPVNVAGSGEVRWQNDEEQKGFVDSHHGPCEVWIDDIRVFHGDDCRAEFTSFPAVLPVDYSACQGQCTLRFYWLALHEPEWQAYKSCVPIVNGDSSIPVVSAPAPIEGTPIEVVTLPAPIDDTPIQTVTGTVVTDAPSTSAPAYDETPAPVPTTATPSPNLRCHA